MSSDSFEICGRLIPFSEITEYQIVQREYIYRPSYLLQRQFSLFRGSTEKYVFSEMIPYAAVYDEGGYKLATTSTKTVLLHESILKDAAVGAMTLAKTIGEKKKLKPKHKKYKCINVAGRTFETYLEEIPAVVVREDGRIMDIFEDDPQRQLLGESVAPVIYMIPALKINNLIFYGNGIQLDDVEIEYERLKAEHNAWVTDETARIQAEIELRRSKGEHKRHKSLIHRLTGKKTDRGNNGASVPKLLDSQSDKKR